MISAITSSGKTTADDIVQIYNPCGLCADIGGWTIADRGPGCAANTALYTFPAGTMLPAGGYLLIATGSYNPANYAAGSQAADFTTLAAIGNTGRAIDLLNGATTIDRVGINGALCYEGTGAAPSTAGGGTIDHRQPSAGSDTNSNVSDFVNATIASVKLLHGGGATCASPTDTASITPSITVTSTISPTSTATPSRTPTPSVSPNVQLDHDADPDLHRHAHATRTSTLDARPSDATATPTFTSDVTATPSTSTATSSPTFTSTVTATSTEHGDADFHPHGDGDRAPAP